jgi:tetratricopeptide (TPR) repeat protein
MATNMQSMGRHAEAIAVFRETIAFASGPLLYERFGQLLAPSVFGHAGLAIGLAETGSFEEAIDMGKRGVRIAEARQLPAGNLGYALAGLGRAFLRRGDIDEAEHALKRGIDVCRNFEIPYYEVVLTPLLAEAHIEAGKSKLAIELLERVKGLGQRMSMGNQLPLIIGTLSEALFADGDIDRAGDLAKDAIEITRAQHQRGFEAGLLKLLAKIANRRSEDALAERLYNESLRAAAECGMRPLVAHCHLGLGELYRKLNGASRSHLRLAADLYQEMQMTKWLKKVQMSFDQRSRKRARTDV